MEQATLEPEKGFDCLAVGQSDMHMVRSMFQPRGEQAILENVARRERVHQQPGIGSTAPGDGVQADRTFVELVLGGAVES